MSTRRLIHLLSAQTVALLMLCAPAQALITHTFLGRFRPTANFNQLSVAVDQSTGDVFVASIENGPTNPSTVYKLDSAGNPVNFSASQPYISGNRLTGTPTGPGGSVVPFSFLVPTTTEVAIDSSNGPAKGDIYIPESSGVVDIFAPDGSYLGQLTGSNLPEGPYSSTNQPCGVAVDATGSVYVGDISGFVDKYTPTGNPVTDSNYVSELQGLNQPCDLAVDSSGNVYATTFGFAGGPVTRYDPSQFFTPPGTGVSAGTVFDPNNVFGVAIDRAVDLVTGSADDVYMSERPDVAQYASTGVLVSGIDDLNNNNAPLAVSDSTGDIYVIQGNGSEPGVDIFGPGVVQPDVTTSAPATSVTASSATIAGMVAPDGLEAHSYFRYGLGTSYGFTSPSPPGVDIGSGGVGCPPSCTTVPVSVHLTGLEPNATYHYNLYGVNVNGVSGGQDQSFTTLAIAPTLLAESTSGITQTSAILNARINPNNEDTHYQFQLGASETYGTSLPSMDIGSSFVGVGVGQVITGLQPGTTYHYRVVASNAASPPGGIVGADQTFTTPPPTPPVVETGAASNVSQNTASVSGTIDPEGVQTTYEFDVGTDTSYGARVFGNAGSGLSPEAVTAALRGLAPGATYHYRLVATSAFGTVYGADETFTTPVFAGSLLVAPTAAVLVSVPATVFPSAVAGAPEVKALTNAQKLASALKACKKQPSRKQAECQKRARRKYAMARKGGKS